MTYHIDMGRFDGYQEHEIVNPDCIYSRLVVAVNFVAPAHEETNQERWPLCGHRMHEGEPARPEEMAP